MLLFKKEVQKILYSMMMVASKELVYMEKFYSVDVVEIPGIYVYAYMVLIIYNFIFLFIEIS